MKKVSLLPICYSIGFALLAWFFLYVRNADTLYFMQDRGWWNASRLFFDTCIALPGGLLSWAGAYLTQFFYYPALGTAMLIVLWLATFWLAKCSFRIADEWSFLLLIPLAALLCSDIQLGYWVYVLVSTDYLFCHPLGLLAALILSLPFWQLLPVRDSIRRTIALIWIPLSAALFYYPLGIYALLAAAIVAARTISSLKALPLSLLLLGLTIGLVPLLETSGTTLIRPDQPWMCGFHKFATIRSSFPSISSSSSPSSSPSSVSCRRNGSSTARD